MEQVACPLCGHQVTTGKTVGLPAGHSVRCPSCRQSSALSAWRGGASGDAIVVEPPPVPSQQSAPQPPQLRQPRREATKPSLGTDCSVAIVLLIFAVVGAPMAFCGGCLYVIRDAAVSSSSPARERKPPECYTPIEPVVVATDPDYLGLSPAADPRKFLRVLPGTAIVRIGGGRSVGGRYIEFTATGSERMYVYQADLGTKFRRFYFDDEPGSESGDRPQQSEATQPR